jgi:demethoxyubiquinone hydroxylase (CLK1/Coq7/Cat5 family)
MTVSDNDRWIMSYYRVSEINGALFFGRVARIMKPGALQCQVTHHFADEAAHSSYWTSCMEDLGCYPEKQRGTYQDRYFAALGVPANLMEVMAITLVFEKRVIGHYHRHLIYPDTHPRIKQTIERIMLDERRHVRYVREALDGMGARYGADFVLQTVRRYEEADVDAYAGAISEFGERMTFLESAAIPSVGAASVPRISPEQQPPDHLEPPS